MKKLSNLKGAKALSKKEQQSINGGFIPDWTKECGIVTFTSTEQQCYSQPVELRPKWTSYGSGFGGLVYGECSIIVEC